MTAIEPFIMLRSSLREIKISPSKKKVCTSGKRHIKKALRSPVVKLDDFHSLTGIKFSAVFMVLQFWSFFTIKKRNSRFVPNDGESGFQDDTSYGRKIRMTGMCLSPFELL